MRGGNRIKPQPCTGCGVQRKSRHLLCHKCRYKTRCTVCLGPKPKGRAYCDACQEVFNRINDAHTPPCPADKIGRKARVAERCRRADVGLGLWEDMPDA